MSLFGRPVIFLPGDGDWDCSRRFRVSGAPGQRLRRRPYSRQQVSRHPLDYLFDVGDPFNDLYLDGDDPEENIYDMFDLPASYSIGQPRRVYVYKTKKNPDYGKRGLAMRNEDFVPQTRSAQKSGKEAEQSTDGERKAVDKNGDVVVMDLDELAGHLLRRFYDLGSKPRNGRKREMVNSRTGGGGERRERKVGKEASDEKSSQTRTTTTTKSQSESVKETIPESESKRNGVERKRCENEKKNDETTPKEGNTAINEEKNRENGERERTNSDELQLVFVVEDDAREEDKDWSVLDSSLKEKQKHAEREWEAANDNLLDCSGNVSETEERETGLEREDVCQITRDEDRCSEEDKSDVEVEIREEESSNLDEVDEPMESGDLERKLTEEVEECDRFRMTFDLSCFRPEEIQVKLSDDRLILDAVHEDVKEGLIEKRSVQKVIALPAGVDRDSLRCLLGDDGHMTISANYLEKRKESKILTIEMQAN